MTPVRRFLILPAAIALTASGCARPDRRDTPTITIQVQGDERILSPLWDTAAQHLVFLPLVTLNDRGERVGLLARSWQHSADFRTWTIRLRGDVLWHDGTPFTAHDVKFSMDLWTHPAVRVAAPGTYEVSVLDDTTYRVRYARASYPLSNWRTYVPAHLLRDLDPEQFGQWEFWTRPVGNGPYRYVRHVEKTFVELEANRDYIGGRPRIERVILRFGEPLITELGAGNVDMLTGVEGRNIAGLRDQAGLRAYYHVLYEFAAVVFWNHRHPLLGDARVRRALTLALDRKELHRALDLPADLRYYDVPFSDPQYWQRAVPAGLEPDPATARRLLEEAGWKDPDGDGVRQRDDTPLALELLAGPLHQREAVVVQEQLRRVGAAVTIRQLDGGVARRRVRARQFEAAILGFENTVRGLALWFPDTAAIGYSNPDASRLIRQLEVTLDPASTDSLYRELHRAFQLDLPAIFLYPQVTWALVNSRVGGLTNPMPDFALRLIDRLWLGERR